MSPSWCGPKIWVEVYGVANSHENAFKENKFCCKHSDKNKFIELCAMTFQGN